MIRHAVLPLLLLTCACSSLSSDEQRQLAEYQSNARIYWEGNRLSQALGQIERGLALDPDDYSLNTLKGAILLKQSPSSQGTDHRLLDEATAILERVFDTRSERRHEPALLFNYALALQKQGRRRNGEATRLQAMLDRNVGDVDADMIPAHRDRAAADLELAEQLLEGLIERGFLFRLSHYHLLLAACDADRPEEVAEHSKAYLAQSEKEQDLAENRIRETNTPGYELEQKALLARLRREELEVRSLLADYHYDRKEYALALAMLDRVLEIDPRRSTDYYNRGRVLLQLDRDDDAKADFRKFLATTDLPATSDKAIFAAASLSQ